MSRPCDGGGTAPATPSSPAPAPAEAPPRAWRGTGAAVALAGTAGLAGGWAAALAPWWSLPALLLCSAGALGSGALWAHQRQARRLQAARHQQQQQQQLLDHLLEAWHWQTDAAHRLVRWQPPARAPVADWAAWAAPATGAPVLWQHLDDAAHTLQARMCACSALLDLAVQAPAADGAAAPVTWQLRGLPRLDADGRFEGYAGLAWPLPVAPPAEPLPPALLPLLQHSPAALCLACPADDGSGWRLQRASPGARQLLGLASLPEGGQPWAQALGHLPDGLRQRVLALKPGDSTEADGWCARLDGLAPDGACLLTLAPAGPGSDSATQALAAEHAAFSYTISHDLRAPIRVVEGFGRILKEDYGDRLDRVGRDHIDRVMAAAARMNHMIDALLSLSRLSTQPLVQQPVNLSQLAGFVVDELRRATPERQVSVHIAPHMVASGDPTLLRMALENLLGNAWKYSAKNPQAAIRFEPEAAPDGRCGFVLGDNGAGFDMRFADRLFGVFQRLHSSSDFPGTGIGLASVRRIVRRHGGEIWAESEVGQGARFHFTLKR